MHRKRVASTTLTPPSDTLSDHDAYGNLTNPFYGYLPSASANQIFLVLFTLTTCMYTPIDDAPPLLRRCIQSLTSSSCPKRERGGSSRPSSLLAAGSSWAGPGVRGRTMRCWTLPPTSSSTFRYRVPGSYR